MSNGIYMYTEEQWIGKLIEINRLNLFNGTVLI